MQKQLVQPNRRRKIEGSFGYIPHRFLRDGFFQSLSPVELALYLFFVVVSDAVGLSYYGFKTIQKILDLEDFEFQEAFGRLHRRDLIASEGTLVQVLSLPQYPVTIDVTEEL